jgi:hypothetical protein
VCVSGSSGSRILILILEGSFLHNAKNAFCACRARARARRGTSRGPISTHTGRHNCSASPLARFKSRRALTPRSSSTPSPHFFARAAASREGERAECSPCGSSVCSWCCNRGVAAVIHRLRIGSSTAGQISATRPHFAAMNSAREPTRRDIAVTGVACRASERVRGGARLAPHARLCLFNPHTSVGLVGLRATRLRAAREIERVSTPRDSPLTRAPPRRQSRDAPLLRQSRRTLESSRRH